MTNKKFQNFKISQRKVCYHFIPGTLTDIAHRCHKYYETITAVIESIYC